MAVSEFLRGTCRNLLAEFPDVKRWDQTDDIFQQAAVRLYRALRDTKPESRRHLENLAAMQVRRTLIDLGRKYAVSVAMNRERWTPHSATSKDQFFSSCRASREFDPVDLMDWVELHERVDDLPDNERAVFQLIWYRGLSKSEVAQLLDLDIRTVQRRWRVAREMLSDGGLA